MGIILLKGDLIGVRRDNCTAITSNLCIYMYMYKFWVLGFQVLDLLHSMVLSSPFLSIIVPRVCIEVLETWEEFEVDLEKFEGKI